MQAPEVRDALFQKFIDVRFVLKGRFPRKLLKFMAKDLYKEWLDQQPEPIPKDKQLQFGNHWIRDWMVEYGVSLKKPNKRFSISQEDRIKRILQYLKNVIRVRMYFLRKFNTEPIIINGDQMPLHRNEVRLVFCHFDYQEWIHPWNQGWIHPWRQ